MQVQLLHISFYSMADGVGFEPTHRLVNSEMPYLVWLPINKLSSDHDIIPGKLECIGSIARFLLRFVRL